MIYLNVWLRVKNPADVERVGELLAAAGRLSRAEPGCARWEAYHSHNEANCFLLHEWWESPAALDAHRLAEAYTTIYQPQVLPLVERQPHPCTRLD